MNNSKTHEQISFGDIVPREDTALPAQQPEQVQQSLSMWSDKDASKHIWSMANLLAKSDMVPKDYKSRPENCLIAIDIANRIGWSPLTVMQNLVVVNGHPGWNGQASIAIVNGCGRFTPLQFEFSGEPGSPDWGCMAYAIRKENGEKCVGPKVTWKMAVDEGWARKEGSKWKTMPELMMRYRAGAFFARVHCPDALLGIPTIEEVEDVYGPEAQQKKTIKVQATRSEEKTTES